MKEYYINHKRITPIFVPFYKLRGFLNSVDRFFTVQNFKHALVSVKRGWRSFGLFFAALFLLQSMFWCFAVFASSNDASLSKVSPTESYTVMVDNMTDAEWVAIYNRVEFRESERMSPEDRGYESVEYEEYRTFSGKKRYRISFVLAEETMLNIKMLLSRYKIGGANAHIYYGKALAFDEKNTVEHTPIWWFTVAVFALIATVSVSVLFRIRANQSKFTFGIYMTFGADTEKLLETSGWELIIISLLTLLPSLLFSLLLCGMIFLSRGGALSVSPTGIALAMLWNILVVILGVVPSARHLSTQPPVALIAAADNSNFVTSPRRSYKIFNKSFPRHYEILSFSRFRTYYISLIAAAVLFTSMFSCGMSIAEALRADPDGRPEPKYTVYAGDGERFEEYDVDYFNSIDGVSYALKHTSTDADELFGSRLIFGEETERARSTSKFTYLRCDEEYVSRLVNANHYETDGDLNAVPNDPHTVAVGIPDDSNIKVKVGDVINIAHYTHLGNIIVPSNDEADMQDGTEEIPPVVTDSLSSLEYIRLTVSAVFYGADVDEGVMIGVSPELFDYLPEGKDGDSPVYIYTEPDLSADRYDEILREITYIAADYEGYSIDVSTYHSKMQLTAMVPPDVIAVFISVSLLLVIPMLWFYSQSGFYAKRRGELSMLEALGARREDIKRLFFESGAMITVLTFAATALAGLAVSFVMTLATGLVLPLFGASVPVVFGWSDVGLQLLAALLVSLSCGVPCAMKEYVGYNRYAEKKERV